MISLSSAEDILKENDFMEKQDASLISWYACIHSAGGLLASVACYYSLSRWHACIIKMGAQTRNIFFLQNLPTTFPFHQLCLPSLTIYLANSISPSVYWQFLCYSMNPLDTLLTELSWCVYNLTQCGESVIVTWTPVGSAIYNNSTTRYV